MAILKLLAADNFLSVNKHIARCLGLNEAIILGELAGRQDYYQQNNELEEGFFYETVQRLEENTTLKESAQRKAIQHLYTLGILDICYKGMPQRRYFRINETKLLEVLNKSANHNCFEKQSTSDANYKALAPLRAKQYKNNNNNDYKNDKVEEDKLPQATVNTNDISETITEDILPPIGYYSNEDSTEQKYKELKHLTIEELERLKQIVLENRDSKLLTYREIQKMFDLVDKVTYDTPTECNKLISQKRNCSIRLNKPQERSTGFSEEIF